MVPVNFTSFEPRIDLQISEIKSLSFSFADDQYLREVTGFKIKVGDPVTFSYLVLKTNDKESKLLLLGFTNNAIKSIIDNLLLKNPEIILEIPLNVFFSIRGKY